MTPHRSGYNRVDVILVVSIVLFLLMLIFPLIQNTRESSRMTQCKEKLRHLGEGIQQHVTIIRCHPTGGWGWAWFGDADGGTGINQPGGWCFCILPYLDHQAAYDSTKDGKREPDRFLIGKMVSQPLPEFICPSRREAKATPLRSGTVFKTRLFPLGAKTDYAINRGDWGEAVIAGPGTWNDKKFKWPNTSQLTGISYLRSEVREADITDGLANTFLVGEKHVEVNHYLDGRDSGDDGSLYQGDDRDIARVTWTPPMPDIYHDDGAFSFGSAHPLAWNMLFCDGSMRSLSYDIDPDLHCKLGNRCDGQKLDPNSLGLAE